MTKNRFQIQFRPSFKVLMKIFSIINFKISVQSEMFIRFNMFIGKKAESFEEIVASTKIAKFVFDIESKHQPLFVVINCIVMFTHFR